MSAPTTDVAAAGVVRLLVIGAQRSGTTLLWHLLDGHPDIEMAPLRPEPKFFLRDDVDTGDPAEWDHEVFGGPPTTSARGEKSTTYLERGDVAARVVACVPDVHVVAVLRDPVDRALSNWRFSRQHGWETWSLADAMTDRGEDREWPRDRLSASPFHHRRRGRYADLLAPWAAAVGPRLHLLEHGALVADPTAATDRLVTALGLPPSPRGDDDPGPVNASTSVDVPGPELARVRRSLARWFAGPNRDLARTFGVDVTGWTTPEDDHDQPGDRLGHHEGR